MPVGAEVNAILILLKVCNGVGWRAATDIHVHHEILCKLSVINLKYTLETCLWDHEKEAGGGGSLKEIRNPDCTEAFTTMGPASASNVHNLPLLAPGGCCTMMHHSCRITYPRFSLTSSSVSSETVAVFICVPATVWSNSDFISIFK